MAPYQNLNKLILQNWLIQWSHSKQGTPGSNLCESEAILRFPWFSWLSSGTCWDSTFIRRWRRPSKSLKGYHKSR